MTYPDPAAEKVVEALDLSKVFRDFWHRAKVKAVDTLSFSVSRGEVFGLLGPNGSGKTTTIRMMLGLLYPTRGFVRVLGLPPHNVAVKKRIGYLPEESYLYKYLTANETLHFYGRLFDIPAAERRRRVESLLDMVGLTGARKRALREYSKGMARRIGLAQALINDPELLILDEPTTGLDPVGTREIKDLILSLKKRGKTVFLSSHLLADVEDVCDRVAILYGGRLCVEGSVADLLAQKGLTQIRTERLSGETLAKIKDLIRRMEGDKTVSVETPRENLESLFLRVVGKARQERVATSGAEAGRIRGDFLVTGGEEEKSQAVISSLMATPLEVESSEPQAGEKPPEGKPAEDQSVIDELTRSDGEA